MRGEFTRDYLVGLGFGDDEIDVIGCPSMFMEGPDPRADPARRRGLDPSSPIALNISPYLTKMGPVSLDLAERYPNLVYLAQDLRTLQSDGARHASRWRSSGPPSRAAYRSLSTTR